MRQHRAIISLVLGACAFAQPAERPNLVLNGGFSAVTAGKPDRWQAGGNPDDVDQVLKAAKDEQGNPCAELICTRCDARGPSSHAMLYQVGGATLIADRMYEFSCRMRAENLKSQSVGIAFQEVAGWRSVGLYETVAVRRSWKEYRLDFLAERGVGATGRLQIWFTEPGTLWVSNVRIAEAPRREAEFTDVIPEIGAHNLLVNGSFEVGTSGWSSLGSVESWGAALSALHGDVEPNGGLQGRPFLRIPLGGERTPVTGFDYYEPFLHRELRPLAVSLGWIRVVPGAPYTLSCDLRASRGGVRAMLGARAESPSGDRRNCTTSLLLTPEWKRYSFTFKPQERYLFVAVGPDLAEEDRVEVDVSAVQLEKGERATAWQPRRPLEFAMEPSEPAGIFTEGRPMALILRAANFSDSEAQVPVHFTVTDFFDKPVALPDASLTIPPNATAQAVVKLPREWKGYYRVRAQFGGAADAEVANLRLALVPPRASDDSVCGINHAFATPYLIQLASKAGVTWYRDWSLKWQHIEPVKGQFHWEVGDAQIDRVLREGCHVLPLLPPFPSAEWSSEAPTELATKGYPGVRLRQAWAPEDRRDLASFVEKAVAHCKDRIRIYEFLNEPVFTDYALPGRSGGAKYTAADYTALLELAAGAMKRADPACKVIGGIAGDPELDTREVINAGCLKYVDFFNLHIYPGHRLPEGYLAQMDHLLGLMDAAGGRKPIWMTEFSYYGADDLPRKPFLPRSGSWSETRLLNERECAELTVRFFAVMLSHGVEKIFIHSGTSGRANDPDFECALFDYGGAPRRLLPAMAVLTELLGPKPVCAGYRRLAEAGHAAAFETGRNSVLVVWEEEEGPSLALSGIPAGARCLDIMGRDTLPLKLSPSALYLIGPPGKAGAMLAALRVSASPR